MSVGKHHLAHRKRKTERHRRHLPGGNILTNATDFKKPQIQAARVKPDLLGKMHTLPVKATIITKSRADSELLRKSG